MIWLVAPAFNRRARFRSASRTSAFRSRSRAAWVCPLRRAAAAACRCCRSTTRTSSRCSRIRTRGGTEMSSRTRTAASTTRTSFTRTATSMCARSSGSCVVLTVIVAGGRRGDVGLVQAARPHGAEERSRACRRSALPAGRAPPAPRTADDAVDGSEAVPRRTARASPRLRLGRRDGRRRAHADRQGEGDAAEEGAAGAAGARRCARRHARRRRAANRTADGRSRQAADKSSAGAAPAAPAPAAPRRRRLRPNRAEAEQ